MTGLLISRYTFVARIPFKVWKLMFGQTFTSLVSSLQHFVLNNMSLSTIFFDLNLTYGSGFSEDQDREDDSNQQKLHGDL